MIAEIQKIENAARLSFGDFSEARQHRPNARPALLTSLAVGVAALALPVATLIYYL
jgi:hypothetical protein